MCIRDRVGAAGKLFTRALEELGLDRSTFYLTHALKHFSFEQRGRFRVARTPEASHLQACRSWLQRELATVRPHVVMCLGEIATQSVSVSYTHLDVYKRQTYDCAYCVNRVSSNVRRARFTPAEVVQLTLDFYKRNYIEGLFLSSGIIRDSDYTMEQMVEVAVSYTHLDVYKRQGHPQRPPGDRAARGFAPAPLGRPGL